MKIQPWAALVALAIVVVLAVSTWSCSTASVTRSKLRYFLLTAPIETTVSVECDGRVAYRVHMQPGKPLEIGGPEALCDFVTDQPVRLEIEAVWDGR